MTKDIGGNIGARMAGLAFQTIRRANSVALAIVTKVDMDRMKCDVKLKNTKQKEIVKLFSCPVVTQSYAGGCHVMMPRVGDLVVVIFNKYNTEDLIKHGSLKIEKIDEMDLQEQNFGLIIGTVFPLPQDEGNPPDTFDSGNAESPAGSGGEERYFMRPPVYHAEKVEKAKQFVADRLCPKQNHYIWYHPYDHEIRMTREEIHIKHKTGTQIIFREPGDLEIYVWKKMLVHAKNDITIDSEMNARMNSFVPPKKRPYRVQ